MQKSTFEAILAAQRSSKEIYCHTITAADIDNGTAELTNGFFIILVTNGTVAISDTYDFEAGARDLMLLTPSMRAAFTDIDDTLSMICLGIDPDYFDSLRFFFAVTAPPAFYPPSPPGGLRISVG